MTLEGGLGFCLLRPKESKLDLDLCEFEFDSLDLFIVQQEQEEQHTILVVVALGNGLNFMTTLHHMSQLNFLYLKR